MNRPEHDPGQLAGPPPEVPNGVERRRQPRFEIEILGIVLELGPEEEFGPLEQVGPLEELGLMDELGAIDDGTQEDSGRPPVQGRTRNISLLGALVEVGQPLEAGIWIQLSLALADEPIEIRSRVLECRTEGRTHLVRVEFLNLAGPSQALLEAYIEDWRERAGA